MLRKISPASAVFFLTACLTGCIFFPSKADRATRKSPSFQAGYADGCGAATAQSSNYREGPYRDEALYKSDEVYRAGWSSGYHACRMTTTGEGTNPTNPISSPVH